MKNQKKRSFAILLVLLLSAMLIQPQNMKVKAEDTDSTVPTFTEVKSETIGFALQYKDKTIIKNVNIVDNNLKLFIEENGQRHIISEDFNFLRWLHLIGIYNDNLYVIQDTAPGKPIYKVDLNTYKLEFVKNMPTYPVGNPEITDIAIDKTGTMWFQGHENTRYMVFNEKGFKFEFSKSGTSYSDKFSGLQLDQEGNIWFFKTFGTGTENKLYRVSQDGQVKEFTLPTNYTIKSINLGANNTLYVVDGQFNSSTYGFDKNFVQSYVINGDTIQLVKEFDMGNKAVFYDKDINGNLWVDADGVISKFEEDNLVKKYIVADMLKAVKVYDDKHLVATGIVGGGYFNISLDDVKAPSSPEKFLTTLDSKTKSAAVTLETSQIAKNGVNEITLALSTDVQTLETKIDAAAINGGTGSLMMNANNVTMEIPFSTVDFEGTTQGSYVSVKQNIIASDPILSGVKDIGKVFDFSLGTYKQDGTKIKDIHNFKSGKAKITVKLTSDDIKNLDITKLGAFYYNEGTKMWELIGGTFDKNAMTFTFETPHFSKYTIAQINGTLPQTGAFLNNNDLIIAALVLIVLGVVMFVKKPRME